MSNEPTPAASAGTPLVSDQRIDEYINAALDSQPNPTPRGLVRRVAYTVRDEMQAAIDALRAGNAELARLLAESRQHEEALESLVHATEVALHVKADDLLAINFDLERMTRLEAANAKLKAAHDGAWDEVERYHNLMLDMEQELASLRAKLQGAQAALQWALDEGGWRLVYYASSIPGIVDAADMYNAKVRQGDDTASPPAGDGADDLGSAVQATASSIAMSLLKERHEAGHDIHIPSLDITIPGKASDGDPLARYRPENELIWPSDGAAPAIGDGESPYTSQKDI